MNTTNKLYIFNISASYTDGGTMKARCAVIANNKVEAQALASTAYDQSSFYTFSILLTSTLFEGDIIELSCD